MPQLAIGVANGLVTWAGQAVVLTVDTGTLGAGVSIAPLIVPSPLLLQNILIAYAAQGMLGPMAPLQAAGLANGISLGLLQGQLIVYHTSVGAGACVARITGTSVPSIIAGFASAGMTGPSGIKQATAIGIAIDLTFTTFTTPLPIVGPPSISPGAGVGAGKIV
jgi:hypothetical protein